MTEIRNILLVEDNERDLELTLTAFSEQKLANEVHVARDGEEALDFLYCRGKFSGRADGLPCVVFLDLKMPKLNGLEVLRQMKSDPALDSIPVVMVTSSREEPDLKASYDLGVNAYVVKPVDFEQFFESMKQLGMFWAVINQPPPQPSLSDASSDRSSSSPTP